MLNQSVLGVHTWDFMGQVGPPPLSFGPTDIELWPYRARTTALLRRYARASVEAGRLPSMLGREFFRARLTSYSMKSCEDVVIFVADMDRSLDLLSQSDRKLLTMNVLEDYTVCEVSRLLRWPQRTVERQLQTALDDLSRILLKCGLVKRLS
ncbi:MAG: hypothetical protein WCC04_15245 [Terriglobales bacterium]